LATLEGLIDEMQPLYPINANGPGIGIGRYPEDLYDGIDSATRGNPWYLQNLRLPTDMKVSLYERCC